MLTLSDCIDMWYIARLGPLEYHLDKARQGAVHTPTSPYIQPTLLNGSHLMYHQCITWTATKLSVFFTIIIHVKLTSPITLHAICGGSRRQLLGRSQQQSPIVARTVLWSDRDCVVVISLWFSQHLPPGTSCYQMALGRHGQRAPYAGVTPRPAAVCSPGPAPTNDPFSRRMPTSALVVVL